MIPKMLLRLLFLPVLVFTFFSANARVDGYLLNNDKSCKIWWAESTYKIMRDDPAPQKKGNIVIHSARNEYEGFQLVLSPEIDIDNISITISDFSQKSGSLIAANNVSIRNVEYVHIKKPSGIHHSEGWFPDPLPLYQGPISIVAGVNTPIWFTVKIPLDALAGTYSAKISLKSATWEMSIPVELEVWDFALPDVPYMRSAFGLYSGLIEQYHNLDNTEELKQVLDQYYQSFKEYRISPQHFNDQYQITKEVKGAWWNGGTFDPDTVFSGKYSYQITDKNRNGNVAGTCADLIPINPEKPYWIKWHAKTLKNKQQYFVSVKSYTPDKKLIPWQLQGMYYSGSTHWRKDSLFLDPVNPIIYEGMVLSRPIPKEARYISVQLYAVMPDEGGAEQGTVWFDEVQCIDIKTGENLLPKGNFEQDINDLEIEIDYSEFDIAARKYLDEFKFTGFRLKIGELRPGSYFGRKTGWFDGFIHGTPEYDKLIKLYLGSLQDHLETNGWLGKEYLYWIDEPKHDDYEFVREGMVTIHEAAPKLTRLITENNPGPEIMDVTDIGCPVLAKFDPEASKEWISKGRQMWSYLMAWPKAPHLNLFIDSDAIDMRMWLWMSYRYNLTGILVWNSNSWNKEGCSPSGVLQNVWEDPMSYMDGHGLPVGAAVEHGNGDGMFFYHPNRNPNTDKTKYICGPVPSIRLEILREGIDDYDYMKLLEKSIENAQPNQQVLVKKAKQLLRFGDEVFVNDKEYTKNTKVLMNYRKQMGVLLEKFHAK
jgi:hypothetical protein